MSIYKGTTLIAGALPNAANQNLSNLSQTGQAVIDGKADTDLTNLTSTASPNFDGQIVQTTLDIITSTTSINSNETKTYDLSSYLPDDNYTYEVYYSVAGETGTTSGNNVDIVVSSALLPATNRVARARTRASSSVTWCGSGTIPITGANRNISVTNLGSAGSINFFRVLAYRRVGTNQ